MNKELELGGLVVIADIADSSLIIFLGGWRFKPTRPVRMCNSRWDCFGGCALLYVLEEVDDFWSRFGAVADMMVIDE